VILIARGKGCKTTCPDRATTWERSSAGCALHGSFFTFASVNRVCIAEDRNASSKQHPQTPAAIIMLGLSSSLYNTYDDDNSCNSMHSYYYASSSNVDGNDSSTTMEEKNNNSDVESLLRTPIRSHSNDSISFDSFHSSQNSASSLGCSTHTVGVVDRSYLQNFHHPKAIAHDLYGNSRGNRVRHPWRISPNTPAKTSSTVDDGDDDDGGGASSSASERFVRTIKLFRMKGTSNGDGKVQLSDNKKHSKTEQKKRAMVETKFKKWWAEQVVMKTQHHHHQVCYQHQALPSLELSLSNNDDAVVVDTEFVLTGEPHNDRKKKPADLPEELVDAMHSSVAQLVVGEEDERAEAISPSSTHSPALCSSSCHTPSPGSKVTAEVQKTTRSLSKSPKTKSARVVRNEKKKKKKEGLRVGSSHSPRSDHSSSALRATRSRRNNNRGRTEKQRPDTVTGRRRSLSCGDAAAITAERTGNFRDPEMTPKPRPSPTLSSSPTSSRGPRFSGSNHQPSNKFSGISSSAKTTPAPGERRRPRRQRQQRRVTNRTDAIPNSAEIWRRDADYDKSGPAYGNVRTDTDVEPEHSSSSSSASGVADGNNAAHNNNGNRADRPQKPSAATTPSIRTSPSSSSELASPSAFLAAPQPSSKAQRRRSKLLSSKLRQVGITPVMLMELQSLGLDIVEKMLK